MKDSKVLAFIFGAIPMTLLQYVYWNWLIYGLTKGVGSIYWLFIIPMIAAIVYCVYERYFVFSFVSVDSTFRERIPLAVLWILECIIGITISTDAVYEQIPHSGYGGSFSGLVTAWCLYTGLEMVFSFVCCRLFLYVKVKEVKQFLLAMLVIRLLKIVISAFMDWY